MPKKSKAPAPVHIDQTVSESFQTIMRHNYDYLVEWEDTARSSEDIEGVHQVRVSFRRIRSAFSAFRQAIPKEQTVHWAEEIRWLAGELGMARDLDVLIDEGLEPIQGKLPLAGEQKMMTLAEEHREKAYIKVGDMLDSTRYAIFRSEFPAWVNSRGWEDGEIKPKKRKRLESPVLPYSSKLLDRLDKRVLAAGSEVDKTIAEDMHELRIQCKKLRYGAEFFLPIINGLDAFIQHMKGLQDILGVLNDVAVTKLLLDQLLADQTDAEVLEYADGLLKWRTTQYHELLGSFEDRWDEFVVAERPWRN